MAVIILFLIYACIMVLVLKGVFFLSLFVIIYTYIGYPVIVWILVSVKKLVRNQVGTKKMQDPFPPVTLVVAAYNEEEIIEAKIINSFQLDYPKDALKIVFISDGSTDRTPEKIEHYNGIEHLHQQERKGKLHAMNRAMAFVNTAFVVFTDANSMLNKDAIKNLMRHYSDPRVGGVAGEKKVYSRSLSADIPSSDLVGKGEGLYWRYESFLKKLDADLYSIVGAAGELFSMKTELYEELPSNTILEDFVQSLRVCQKGYIIKYEAGAFAVETASPDIKEEIERKIRISAGGFQAIIMLKSLLLPFKRPILSFQYISHRVLRWTLAPLSLLLCLVSSFALILYRSGGFYELVFWVQAVFITLAIIGWRFALRGIRSSVTYFPYYFCMMNFCVFAGFKRWLNGGQHAIWTKASRR